VRATRLARALDFASAIFPAGKTKLLVLLTDGNEQVAGARQFAGGGGGVGAEDARHVGGPAGEASATNLLRGFLEQLDE